MRKIILYIFLTTLALIFILPIIIIGYNAFKDQTSILRDPFSLPNKDSYVGFLNFKTGWNSAGFGRAIFYSFFITTISVLLICILSAMCAWYLARVKKKFTKVIYYVFVFSMLIPFQMVMFSLTQIASMLYMNNPLGIILIYIAYGSALSVFTYFGFIRGLPVEIEEAALIDGCNPIQCFFRVIMPTLAPISITIAILNAMWIWNDYLLPYLILGSGQYKTIPVAIQLALTGLYGSINWGAFMAMLVFAIIPIIIFYLFGQKYIIKGVLDGSIKG